MKKRILLGMLLFAGAANAMTVISPAFQAGSRIPTQYTCAGQDISPPLAWSNVPPNTEAFAIIMRDPDSPSKNWIHWVMYNLPMGTLSIPANYEAKMAGALIGKNSWNVTGYSGPCPKAKPGVHHYRYEVYALDQALYVDPGLTAAQLTQAMSGHILGMATLIGTYSLSAAQPRPAN